VFQQQLEGSGIEHCLCLRVVIQPAAALESRRKRWEQQFWYIRVFQCALCTAVPCRQDDGKAV
jgi:hypothetical protein